jgi:hypothetical protein
VTVHPLSARIYLWLKRVTAGPIAQHLPPTGIKDSRSRFLGFHCVFSDPGTWTASVVDRTVGVGSRLVLDRLLEAGAGQNSRSGKWSPASSNQTQSPERAKNRTIFLRSRLWGAQCPDSAMQPTIFGGAKNEKPSPIPGMQAAGSSVVAVGSSNKGLLICR